MFATDENMRKAIEITHHAKQRARENGIDLNDLESMLLQSQRRERRYDRGQYKQEKHGEYHHEYELDDVYFVVAMYPDKAVLITCGKFLKHGTLNRHKSGLNARTRLERATRN